MKTIQQTFWRWLPFAIVATIFAGLIYVAVQQNYRQNANDPQIQLSEDASALLASGQPPQIFGSTEQADISKSLTPFIIVYDEQGKAVSNTAMLNGSVPNLPQGVLNTAKQNGSNRITWEPQSGVRIAAVVSHYTGTASSTGYVLVGRSLREVEKRIDTLMLYVFVAWISALVATFLVLAYMPTARELK